VQLPAGKPPFFSPLVPPSGFISSLSRLVPSFFLASHRWLQIYSLGLWPPDHVVCAFSEPSRPFSNSQGKPFRSRYFTVLFWTGFEPSPPPLCFVISKHHSRKLAPTLSKCHIPRNGYFPPSSRQVQETFFPSRSSFRVGDVLSQLFSLPSVLFIIRHVDFKIFLTRHVFLTFVLQISPNVRVTFFSSSLPSLQHRGTLRRRALPHS